MLELCRRALEQPLGTPPIAELAGRRAPIVILISDASRDEPREAMLQALLEQIGRDRVSLVVAAGTHTHGGDVVPPAFRDLPCVVHDATRGPFVDLGITERGTRVRLLEAVARAGLVIGTGRIRPHYFAGFSGGAKSVFPGCAALEDALTNHRLKADATARLGRVEDNACRLDLEQAAQKLPGTFVVLNVLADAYATPVAAASGHPVLAHRALLAEARASFTVRAPRAKVVVVADVPPVTSTLYQASKLLPPAGALLEPGGVVVCVAECSEGTGPLERVNEGIYRLGVRRHLPERHRVLIVSELEAARVADTYAEHAGSLEAALARAFAITQTSQASLLWRAGECIAEAA
jgi:nickel-dependent lactate racemase